MSDPNHALRRAIRDFDFRSMFINELGWDNLQAELSIPVDETIYRLKGVAQKRGLVVYLLESAEILPGSLRNKIETQVARSHREHILIFTNAARTSQVWLWALREIGRPLARRSFEYHAGQSGEALAQRLGALAFTLDEEDDLTLVEVAGRVRAAFNVERATKKFYDQFKKERDAFETFVGGIPDVDMSKWYVSVMLNRLMFVYFIQKKGFLDGDPNYLRNRLAAMRATYGADQFDRFYRYFLLRLFHEGLGRPDHDAELEKLIGRVPYLNGGIFQLHQVEERYPDIQIPDAAFANVFDFFDQYQWHLDDRPLRDDREINPDVLGYIFEKYINQKQMGAYYTKEDITEYISKNTIIPFLFDRAKEGCAVAFQVDSEASFRNSVWALPQADPDRYIYEAVRKGAELPLPDDIAAGLDDVGQRQFWNTPTPDQWALPTEIWRETVARRQRYEEIWLKLAGGEIRDVNDFITHNLDIRQFAQDVVEQAEGPDLLAAFWRALTEVSVLDPTCGSGAFLFAALNILEPLYEAAIARMREFVADAGWQRLHPRYAERFEKVLADIERHPNETYYIQKAIIVNNLYGVDIMAEAVEIAKLRLFLKLASQVERVEDVEPLPDIDFNIRTGNTLVGYVKREEVREALANQQVGEGVRQGRIIFGEEGDELKIIEEKAADIDRLYSRFRAMQTGDGGEGTAADLAATKAELQRRLAALNDELDRALSRQYGVDPGKASFRKWRESHQPFHWFTEFYGILHDGGFDVVIGNPPYVEYGAIRRQYVVRGYESEQAGNLYAYVIERSLTIQHLASRIGMVIQLSAFCTPRMISFQDVWFKRVAASHISFFDDRPGKLFDGLQHIRVAIPIGVVGEKNPPRIFTTRYVKFPTETRPTLFQSLYYQSSRYSRHGSSVLKISTTQENEIARKLWASSSTLGDYTTSTNNDNFVYYGYGFGYWGKILNYKPYFKGERASASTGDKYLFFMPEHNRDVIVACMNSSLFYWFYVNYSDGHNFTQFVIKSFPFTYPNGSLETILIDSCERLIHGLSENARIRTANYRATGQIEYEEFYPRLSKPLIDDIDRTLAVIYGFTDEELDYIVNYDIKYRMGDELFAEGEE